VRGFFDGGERCAVNPPPPTEPLVHGTVHRSWNSVRQTYYDFFKPARRPPTGRVRHRYFVA